MGQHSKLEAFSVTAAQEVSLCYGEETATLLAVRHGALGVHQRRHLGHVGCAVGHPAGDRAKRVDTTVDAPVCADHLEPRLVTVSQLAEALVDCPVFHEQLRAWDTVARRTGRFVTLRPSPARIT